MAIAGGTLGCYTMTLRNGRLEQLKSSGNKDTVTENAADAALRILAGESDAGLCGDEKPRRPRRIGQRDKRRATTIERDNCPRPMARLTPQEMAVVKALLAGHTTNKAIAKQLMISWRTVQSHLTNIFAKLYLTNAIELVLVAISDGMEINTSWQQLTDKRNEQSFN